MSKRKLILPICLVIAAIFGIVLGSGSVNAAPSAGVEVSANIQEFLRMALDTNSLAFEDSEGNTTISPSPSGTLASGNVNVAVTTNTDKGFTISAYTHGATTDMTNTNTDLNASIPSVSTATSYDPTIGLSALPTDTWGFRKKTGENTYGNWFGVGTDETHATIIEDANSSSSEYCSTLAYPLNTSGCSAGTYAEHTLNFGANLTPNLPAGTYTNDVVISAIVKSNGARYMLNFDPNGGQNTMASRSIIAGSTFNLPATTNVVKEGYELVGYAFTSSAASPAYTPGQTVNVNDFLTAATSAGQDIDAGITLYLIWEPPRVAFQEAGSCASITPGTTGILKDTRDGQEYTVYRWPTTGTAGNFDSGYPSGMSGYCIMTKDLSLGYVTGGSVTKGSNLTLTADDSVAAATITARTDASDWSADNSDSNLQYINGPEPGYEDYSSHSYYSYGAARKVCPKGWRPPTNNEYMYIRVFTTGGNSSTDSTNIRNAPYSFVYGGKFSGGWDAVGSYGYYWSSTQLDNYNTKAFYIYFNSSELLSHNYDKNVGLSVRCISDDASNTMQDFNSSSLANVGDAAKLRDTRDNKVYTVKKLSDGKVWMIDNLTISATGMVADSLDNTNTNIPSSDANKYYLPPQGKAYQNTDSITNSAVKTASSAVNFTYDDSHSRYPQVGYRAAGTTDNYTGNAVPENTAYYNFYTASLGYSYFQDGKTSGSTPRDICPKGWRLPFVSDNGTSITAASSEFANLARSYNDSASWSGSGATSYNYYTSDSTIRKNMVAGDSGSLDRFASNGAAGFTYAGYYNSTTLHNVGTYGYYWSSSVYNTYSSYILNFNTTDVYPQLGNNKHSGLAVRCIAGTRS